MIKITNKLISLQVEGVKLSQEIWKVSQIALNTVNGETNFEYCEWRD